MNETTVKVTAKILKTELKPKIKETLQEIDTLVKEFAEGTITELEYREQLDNIPNLGAYIREGDLNLVIK